MKILIIEDQQELVKNMVRYLNTESYLCEVAPDCETARRKIESFEYDCILLDVTLPDGNGLTLLNELKKDNKTDGVIIISAKNSIYDRIEGLNLGADDYLVKPFHLSELNARISAVIRRRKFSGQKLMTLNELTIDLPGKVVFIYKKKLDLTRKEYDLLLFFVSNKNKVVSKNSIAEHLSGSDMDVFDNLDFIYTHIKNLKRKLTQAGGSDNIKSVYGMGYKFEV
ncbi:MAG: response regulator transcription factor [Bacteroidota bacterium]|nr:response regulator transcription factor [Bacteroidota bacterium]MDP4251377.1 response regulator transcription factor [Bacteroidota bacterium]